MTTAVATTTPLTAADRCDRCGAQAYLRVELLSGGELLFCAHHAREHGEALKEVAATMVDETDRARRHPGRGSRRGALSTSSRLRTAPDESPGPFCVWKGEG